LPPPVYKYNQRIEVVKTKIKKKAGLRKPGRKEKERKEAYLQYHSFSDFVKTDIAVSFLAKSGIKKKQNFSHY